MMKTKSSNFFTSLYIPEIKKLVFHLPRVQISGTNNCGESRQTAFKCRKTFQDVLCYRDHAERVVASFPHKIKSKY